MTEFIKSMTQTREMDTFYYHNHCFIITNYGEISGTYRLSQNGKAVGSLTEHHEKNGKPHYTASPELAQYLQKI